MLARQRYYFILIVMMVIISRASYAGDPVIAKPEQCVVLLDEEAMFVGGTNDLTAWTSERPPRKYRLTVFDRAGKKVVGYPGSVGREEKLAPEMLFDGAMEVFTKKGKLSSLYWARERCDATRETESLRPGTDGKAAVKVTVINGKTSWGANTGIISETISIENECLHKLSGWLKNGPEADAVDLICMDNSTWKESISSPRQKEKEWKEFVRYFVPSQIPITSSDVYVYMSARGADGTFAYGDDFSLREVTAGGRNMIEVYPDRNGDKRGWAVVEEGFNPYPVSKCLVEEVN